MPEQQHSHNPAGPFLMFLIIVFVVIPTALAMIFGIPFFTTWRFLLIGGAILLLLKALSVIAGKVEGETGKAERKTTRQGRLDYIRHHVPAGEPLRAALLDVVEEAYALKRMVSRAADHTFPAAQFPATLAPADFQARSEQAIEVALDLTDRFSLIARSAKGRARSARTTEAIEAQQQKLIRLKDALEYSRGTIEVQILTRGEDGASEKLARGLRNLSDAIEESWDDGFDKLEPRSPAVLSADLTPQTGPT